MSTESVSAEVRKPLDPNAIPFFSPRTLRKKVPPPLSVRAKSFVDPAEALEQDEIAGMMEEFILETELADAVIALGEEERSQGDTAYTTAKDEGLLSPRPLTDAEINAEGEEFVAWNAVCEAEGEADPEADPREGLDEASAALETYGRQLLPTPTPSEIEADGEIFVLENEIAELEEAEADEHNEASEALEVMDIVAGMEELHAEEELAQAVLEMAADEQDQTNQSVRDGMAAGLLPPSDAEIEAEAEQFELEVAIAETEEWVDPDADPTEGLDEAAAMLQEVDMENEIALAEQKFALETEAAKVTALPT